MRLSAGILAGREGLDRERMHSGCELGTEHTVDHTMALDPALPCEHISHDINPEVSLSAGAVPGMPFVQLRFAAHLDPHGGKRSRQLVRNRIARAHSLAPTGALSARQGTRRG